MKLVVCRNVAGALILASLAACTGAVGEAPSGAAMPSASGGRAGGGGRGGGAGGGGAAGTGAGGSGGASAPAACAPPAVRLWKLTPNQYTRTVAAVFPHIASSLTTANLAEELATTLPSRQTAFTSLADAQDMSDPHVTQLLQSARKVAGMAAADAGKIALCLATNPADAACVRGALPSFAARAYRRELTSGEIDQLMTLHQAQLMAGADGPTALRNLMTAMLMSPQFLYRTELGGEGSSKNERTTLTGFEKASAISYLLTDGPPDAELFAAAKAGKLDVKAEVEAHARRLLARPESVPGVLRFFAEHFDTRDTQVEKKDAKVFPTWNAQIATDMTKELELFIQNVLFGGGDAKLSTLLTANFGLVNGRLAAFYEVPGIAATAADFSRVTLPNRSGLLTRAGLMASLAHENDTDPVGRGKYIRKTLLCQTLPPPPQNLSVVPPPPDGKRTQRERLMAHATDPTCSGCHAMMDPLGLGLENYDGIGRFRTQEVGKTIDASGTLTMARPEGARWTDAAGLSDLLSRSPEAQRCFVQKTVSFAQGRDDVTTDVCTLDRLSRRFEASGGNMIDLLVGVISDENFFVRRVGG